MSKRLQILTLFLTLVSLNIWGQSRVANTLPDRKVSGFSLPTTEIQSRAETDTLLYPAADEACGGTVTSFTVNGEWGYVGGTNGYGDREKAQRLIYTSNTPYKVIQVWAFFAEAVVVGNGTLSAKVYAVNDTTGGLGALKGESALLTTQDIATDPQGVPVTIFPFPTPPTVTEDEFFVSIDLSDLYAAQDTVGLFSTEDGCGSGEDAWELFEDGTTWVPISTPSISWELEANWALGAVVQFDQMTDVNDPFVAQKGLRLFPTMPNPANNWTDLPYELENTHQVTIEVYSADGKLLQRINKGQQLSGRHKERLDTQNLPSGTYVYGIITDQSRIMSRFVVNR